MPKLNEPEVDATGSIRVTLTSDRIALALLEYVSLKYGGGGDTFSGNVAFKSWLGGTQVAEVTLVKETP